MTAQTRTANKDTDFKVYYSKKIPKKPQQRYFPHRRKTVRAKPGQKDVREPRQMTFLPELMRMNTVQDSESEGEGVLENDDEDDIQVKEEQITPRVQKRNSKRKKVQPEIPPKKGKKRNSDVVQDEEVDEEPIRQPSKRRRRSVAVDVEPNTDNEGSGQEDPRPRLRRQSTMTQLVDGRRPSPGTKEPEFKPVKRVRTSLGKDSKKGSKIDRKQRTLTQMVSGLTSIGIDSDEDMNEDLGRDEVRQSQAYNEAIARRFAERGILEPSGGKAQISPSHRGLSVDAEEGSIRQLPERTEREQNTDEEGAADYEPTQDVHLPLSNTRRTSKRLSSKAGRSPANSTRYTAQKPTKFKFSLLSTPERRKVRMIPSSQSPPDSPFSTQSASPLKSIQRSPLKARTDNPILDTPSKLKRVTFREPSKNPIPAPPALRRFESTIQDSEDEEIWSDAELEPTTERDVGTRTQASSNAPAANVGAETQAILQQIDQACLNADEAAAACMRGASEEYESLPGDREVSEELGEIPKKVVEEEEEHTATVIEEEELGPAEFPAAPFQSSPPITEEESYIKDDPATPVLPSGSELKGPSYENDSSATLFLSGSVSQELPIPVTQSIKEAPETGFSEAVPSMPSPVKPTSTNDWYDSNDDLPSTPMVIDDSSDEEKEDAASTLTRPSTLSAPTLSSQRQSPTDLDGEPVQGHEPGPAHLASQRSSTSHSSKAEKQIQTEWLSHTQYSRMRTQRSSSMHGMQDQFSYQASPHPRSTHGNMAPPQSTAAALFSQATTVDCTQASPHTTPKKMSHYNKSPHTTPKKTISHSQPILSANTTPRKLRSPQQLSSPQRPPPLVIPSSFPSPGRVAMQGWSSPVTGAYDGGGYTQMTGFGGAAEDFSLPPLPPIPLSDDDDDDEL
ncbi:hypothetical protein K504DRAFT_459685 [Pleomassaria siparia CBS 279.74]|uniref:Uncharacterized protein n=1 Tax=Pleomassaria siparia CBS 279.74 TaxID=1314801 RepID=A0A6G1K1R4_9PLEO|nr:hypothetical protein K504DRAFT_459685 [Pleomassaria siparia CBS 279.74]